MVSMWLPFVLGLLLSGTPDEKPWFRVVAYRYSEPWAPVEEGSRILVRLHRLDWVFVDITTHVPLP